MSRKKRPGQAPIVTAPLPVWKKGLFALVAFLGFFALLEAALGLAGFQPALYEEDPYVGFASNIPLYVERPGGWMETAPNKLQAFNRQRFRRLKPRGVRRIFSVGGSTTYGRPYEDEGSFSAFLRALLPLADPSREWEVINAGGVSYASYRVAKLMEELVDYEPDLFVVYSGHNEFLERRTYADLIETAPLVADAGGLLSRTRIYSAGARLLRPPAAPAADRRREVLETEVDAILDHSVGPEDYSRDDRWRRQVLAHYRYNLDRMVNVARSVGAEILFVVPASNLADCSPFKSEPNGGLSAEDRERFEQFRAQARRTPDAAGRLELLDAAAQLAPRAAAVEYERGRALQALGRAEEAVKAYRKAIDEDVCPLRAPSEVAEILREVAHGRDVPLVDFAATVGRLSRDGIADKEYFLDHVHLTLAGYRLLALDVVEALKREGIVGSSEAWTEDAVAAASARVESRIDGEAQGIALRNLAKVFTWAGKTDEAAELALRATELAGDDAESYALLGRSAAADGRVSQALESYGKALEIRPDFPQARFNLAYLLMSEGRLEEAIGHYREAIRLKLDYREAYTGLGIAQRFLRQPKAAEGSFRKALELDERDAESHFELAGLLAGSRRFDVAVRHFRRATELRPEYVEAYSNWGVALLAQKKPTEAAALFEKALAIQPNYVAAQFNLANILATQGDLDGAARRFREVLKQQPDYQPARDALAQIQALRGAR